MNFKGGVSENDVNKRSGNPLRYLRIKAGPQRDRYVHDLVYEAKILGRQEGIAAMRALMLSGELIPERFSEYLDKTFETIDHIDNNSLNNDPGNLVAMLRRENTAKSNRNRARKRSKGDGRYKVKAGPATESGYTEGNDPAVQFP